MEAFAAPYILQTSFIPRSTVTKCVRRSIPKRTSKNPRVMRRQRWNACTEESTKPGGNDDDSTASDLVLPDLRQLFEGAGSPDCEQCEGEGVITCPLCCGTGEFSVTMMDTVSSSQCRLCHGRKVIPCPSCREEVFKAVLWWDKRPSEEEDPDEEWREGPDGEPRIPWGDNPAL